MHITTEELSVLRTLANSYMEIASLPVQKEKMNLWKSFKRRDEVRPMVMIDQIPWHELNYDGSLTCVTQEPFLRKIEEHFRQTLFQWKHFPADMVVEPFLTIPYCVSNYGYGLYTRSTKAFTDKENDVISQNFENQLETEEDVEKIQDLNLSVDIQTSREWANISKFIFDGILPVRQAGGANIKLQIWDILSEFMGVENIYFDLVDRPGFIHRIMTRMTQATLNGIHQANNLGLFDTSANLCHCSGIYTDELLPDFGAGFGKDSTHCWSFAMAQLFTSVSPHITEEFEIPYVKQLAANFGMLYYGCCERLDDRLSIVQTIPNIKKISCSPWSNKENFAANLNPKIIMSNKPSPAFLAAPAFDLTPVVKDLKETCNIAKRNRIQVEFLLKDLSTVQYQLKRLTQWHDAAMKVVETYW